MSDAWAVEMVPPSLRQNQPRKRRGALAAKRTPLDQRCLASPLHAHHLLERMHHIHQVALRFHHRVDVLVGRGRFVDHVLVLAALDAFGRSAVEPIIGKSNRVYEVLNRKRPLTLAMIRRLHQRLGIPADVLIAQTVTG